MNDTHRSLGFTSSGRRIRTFTTCFKGRRPTVSRSPRVLCESRTRLARLEAWSLCRSAKSTSFVSGRRESRTLKAHRSTAFEAAAITNWLALPFSCSKAAAAGIEPASKRLTAALPVPARVPPQSFVKIPECGILKVRTSHRSICFVHPRCGRVGMLRSSVHLP